MKHTVFRPKRDPNRPVDEPIPQLTVTSVRRLRLSVGLRRRRGAGGFGGADDRDKPGLLAGAEVRYPAGWDWDDEPDPYQAAIEQDGA